MKSFYKVLAAGGYSGHAKDATVELDKAVGDALAAAGILAPAPEATAAADAAVDARIREGIDAAVAKAADGIVARVLDSLPEGKARSKHAHPAEAKEKRSFGEFLQAMSWMSPEHPAYQKGVDILLNKYKAQPSRAFLAEGDRPSEWEQGYVKGGGEAAARAFAASGAQGAPEFAAKASALTETSGVLGAFTVPTEFSAEIIRAAGDYAILYPKCKQYQLGTQALVVPAMDYSLGGSGANPYLSGMVASWTADGQNFSQTNPQFREVTYKPNYLGGYTVANRSLLVDTAINMEQTLTELFGRTIAYYLDYGILNGSGVNQPLGIKNAAATIAVSRTTPGNGALLTDVANLSAKLHADNGVDERAFWLLPPSMKADLIPMNDASGRVVYIPNFTPSPEGPIAPRAKRALDGIPIEFSQLPASAGTSGDMYLIDPMFMGVAIRQQIEVMVSPYTNFLANQLVWRFLMRADAQPRLNTYLTLQNGDTVSPFTYRN